jgi:hypothetical protein
VESLQAINFPTVFSAIENLKREMEQLWLEATEQEGLSPTTKYAVFSQSNERARRFEEATKLIALTHTLLVQPTNIGEEKIDETDSIQFSESILGRTGTPIYRI